jgi:Transposase DDE domain
VLIALVVTFDGFPIGYEVFAGNTNDSRTLQTIVTTMEDRHGMLGRASIADHWMASKDNLAWLRQTGRRYIIGAPKSDLKKFAPELATAGAGGRSVRASRSSLRIAPRPVTARSRAAWPTDAAKSSPCTTSSAGGSRSRWNVWPPASRDPSDALIPA